VAAPEGAQDVLKPAGIGMGKDGGVKKVLTGLALVALAVSCVSCGGGEARKTSLDTEIERASYAYGMDVAASMQRSGLELDVDSFVQGFRDTLAGEGVLLTNQEKMEIMQEYANKMREKQMAQREEQAASNLSEGQEFLAGNAARDEVVMTASGLQYEVIEQGSGPKPGPDSRVRVNYTGTLIDGTKFDSSLDRGEPAEFPLNGVIPGWTEALQLMSVGSTYRIYVPPNLAYGERGAPPVIGPNAALIFDIELLEIVE
jgi:FKBP-type peptidyl-prolyl cis-trans isomerase